MFLFANDFLPEYFLENNRYQGQTLDFYIYQATAYLSNGQAYVNGGGGGSGACFMGEIYLTAGDHTITVGGYNGATSVDGLIVAGRGSSGAGNTHIEANGYWGSSAGVGGTVSVTGQTQNVTMQANGNSGANFTGDATATVHSAGGASFYNGWGAGASSNGSPSTGYA